ncbi:MAG: hypothetical protein Q9201_003043 [Fulgogasparrea decipioides]
MAQTIVPTAKAVGELERQRQRLEENAEKLRKSIRYWQTWEAEYEGLKEGLQSLGNDCSSSSLDEVGSQCAGELLSQKEVTLLLRDEKNQSRTSQQVIGLLSRRIEYVQSNVKSLRGSLQAAEDKLTASRALGEDQQRDEEGYPLMEIQEELDDEGNVVSSSITPAGDAAPQVVEALRKAGVNGLPNASQDNVPRSTLNSDSNKNGVKSVSPILKQVDHKSPRPSRNQQPSPSTSESDTKGDDQEAGRGRKSVTFADGTKQAPPAEVRPAKDVKAAKARNTARRIKAEVRGSIDALKKVHNAGFIDEHVFDQFRKEYLERLHELSSPTPRHPCLQRRAPNNKQQDLTDKTLAAESLQPVIPNNESLEDAALRREMIRYNMNEVGAVVAEMNLDDDESDPSSTGESTEESEYRNSSDEDDNHWGMSSSRALSSDYIKEMQALEQKLNAKSIQNVGPHATIETLLRAEDELVVGQDGNPIKTPPEATSTKQGKKNVRFAKALDVQERPSSPTDGNQSQPRQNRTSTPIHTDVVERSPAPKDSNGTAARTGRRKVSQFKGSKLAAAYNKSAPLQVKASNGEQIKTPSLPAFTPPATPKVTPTGPPGRPHAPTVIERRASDDGNGESVPEPDELDGSLLRQELMMDYHRTRNRMIQQQGGYLNQDEEEAEDEGALVDENGKKMSRFKAARLRALG